MAIGRQCFSASGKNVLSAGLNLGTTVLVVRWFGAETYANYIVDLAILAIGLVVLEIVPSSYSVFRMQDDPLWKKSVAAQIAVSTVVVAVVVSAVGNLTHIFRVYSQWITLFAFLQVSKRYLDLRLQSSGRLPEFMSIELANAAIRLPMLSFCLLLRTDPVTSVWSSIAIASLTAQAFWWLRNRDEFDAFTDCLDRRAWAAVIQAFPSYLPYYFGIGLKRFKDNLVPLIGDFLFSSRESLALFLLAYRGLIVTVGQIRIIEAMLNHRVTLRRVAEIGVGQKVMLSFAAQMACIVASAILLLSSGLADLPWLTTVILSFSIWPIVSSVLERSKAYSNFSAGDVNASSLTYISCLLLLPTVIRWVGQPTLVGLALTLVAAEVAAFSVLRRGNEVRNALGS